MYKKLGLPSNCNSIKCMIKIACEFRLLMCVVVGVPQQRRWNLTDYLCRVIVRLILRLLYSSHTVQFCFYALV